MRDYAIENVFKSWLSGLDNDKLTKREKALASGAAIELARATDEEEYKAYTVKVADSVLGGMSDQELPNYKIANSLFYAAMYTGDDKYTDAVKNVAKNIAKQPRTENGVFINPGKEVRVCQAYMSQVFYMKYETMYGGKEHYNDVLAQFNTLKSEYYASDATVMSSDESAAKAVATFAAALIDTCEVVDQPVYEIFDGMRSIYKAVVADIIAAGVLNKCDYAALMAAYAILKGCRMKALHTEKYEAYALKVLEGACETVASSDMNSDCEWMAALSLAYSESLKNREYQDYGRCKGGALWS